MSDFPAAPFEMLGEPTTLYHRRSASDPAHVAMHATDHWLAQFAAGNPATTSCLGCPTAVRFADITVEDTSND